MTDLRNSRGLSFVPGLEVLPSDLKVTGFWPARCDGHHKGRIRPKMPDSSDFSNMLVCASSMHGTLGKATLDRRSINGCEEGPPVRVVTVNDRMQSGYRYALHGTPLGNFDPEFCPELTPQANARARSLLRQIHGVGLRRRNYRELVRACAAFASRGRNCSLNYFGIDASQPLSVWQRQGSADSFRRSARLVSMVLPLLHGPADARTKMRARSSAGRRSGGTSRRIKKHCEPGDPMCRPRRRSRRLRPLGLRQPQDLNTVTSARAGQRSALHNHGRRSSRCRSTNDVVVGQPDAPGRHRIADLPGVGPVDAIELNRDKAPARRAVAFMRPSYGSADPAALS